MLDFVWSYFLIVRSTKLYIAEIKLEQIEETRRFGGVQEIKESYTPINVKKTKANESMRSSDALFRINPSRPIDYEDESIITRVPPRESGS